MSGGRVVALVIGILVAITGLGLTAAGLAVVWAQTQRDTDGFITSDPVDLATDSYALTVDELDLGPRTGDVDWTRWMGRPELRLHVEPADADSTVFVGIGAREDVVAYLQDVAHDRVDLRISGIAFANWYTAAADYERVPGARAPAPPAEETFWAASWESPGAQDLTWRIEPGNWSVLVMNADADAGIAIEAVAGIRTDVLFPIGIGVLLLGVVLLGLATLLIVRATAVRMRPAPSEPPPRVEIALDAEHDAERTVGGPGDARPR